MPDFITNITAKDNASSTINKVKDGFKSIGDSTKDLERIKSAFDKITTSTKPVKKQLQELQALMVNMNVKGLTNTDVFTEVAQKAGELKDAMADARQAVNAYADDTFKINATAEAFQGVASVISLSTSAMALFGKENKDVERTLLKVQAAMGVMNSVQQIANLLNKDSAVMLRLKQVRMEVAAASQKKLAAATAAGAAAEVASNTATKTGTIVQTAWNTAKAIAKALMGDFTGLLLVGAGVMATYAVATAKSADSMEDLGNQQSKTANKTTDLRREMHAASIQGQKDAQDEIVKVNLLYKAATNDKLGKEERLKATDKLQSLYPAYFGNMKKEQIMLGQASASYKQLAQDIINVAKAKAYEQKITQIQTEIIDLEDQKEQQDKLVKSWEKTAKDAQNAMNTQISAQGVAGVNTTAVTYDKVNSKLKEEKKIQSDINKQLKEKNVQAEKYADKVTELSSSTNRMDENKNMGGSSGGGRTPKVTSNTTQEITNLEKLEQKVKDLEKVRANININAPNAKELIDKTNKELKEAKLDVLNYKIAVGIEVEPSSLDKMEQELKDKELLLRTDIPQEDKDKIFAAIEELKKKIEDYKIKAHIVVDPKIKELEELKEKLDDLKKQEVEIEYKPKQSSFEKAIGKKEEPMTLEDQLGGIEDQMDFNDNIIEQLEEIAEKYKELGEAGVEGYTRIQDKIKEVSDEQGKLAEKAAETNDANEKLKKQEKTLNDIGDAAAQTGGMLKQMGEASGSEGLQAAGIIAEAVANVLLGFAKASAQAGSGAAGGPWGWVAFAIAGLATVASMISQIHSLSGFANGGIIGGKTTIGDYNLARVNKGEMILNTRQQENLFKMIDSGRMNNGANAGGKVVFELKGKKLQGVLNNYGDTMKKLR